MGGPERHRRMPPSHAFVTGVCKSGKKAFWTMAGARGLAKKMKQLGSKGLHAYDCPHCDYFHVGHIPKGVVRGRVTKREVFPPKENRAS